MQNFLSNFRHVGFSGARFACRTYSSVCQGFCAFEGILFASRLGPCDCIRLILLIYCRALVHSTPVLQRNGIDYHSLFVAQIHFLPSKSDSKLTISPWLSRFWKYKCIFTWRLTIRVSDSHFGVTLRALQIYLIIIIRLSCLTGPGLGAPLSSYL